MTAVMERADTAIRFGPATQHPAWCQNRDGSIDPDGCACSDAEFLVIHSRGAREVPATDPNRRPSGICMDICRLQRSGDADLSTVAELVIPGGHADLTRAQLRLLIAELEHIDNLWDL